MNQSTSWRKDSTTLPRNICCDTRCDYHSTKHRPGCDTVWKYYASTLFKAFQKANPDLRYRNQAGCALDVIPRHSCARTKDHNTIRGPGFDHDEQARLPGGEKFIISHPYPTPDEPQKELCTQATLSAATGQPGLEVAHAGIARSWYFPTHSTLLIIGLAENIDKINTDYEVPTDYQPQGCVRWQETHPAT